MSNEGDSIIPFSSSWFKLHSDIARRRNIGWNVKAVLALLTHHQLLDVDNPVEMGYRDMAFQLGMDRNTARRAARQLERNGDLQILPRKKRTDSDYDYPRKFIVTGAQKRTTRRNLHEERAIREGKITPMVAK